MQLKIDEIIIRPRIRQNLGDLSRLMESMSEHGLLNPISVTADLELIAGHRRLESAKRLGWLNIDAIVVHEVDEIDQLKIEIDENIHRKPLTPDELEDGYERLRKLQTPPFFVRLRRAIVAFWKRLFSKKRRRGLRGN
jgi:ParB family transcriptional regulator, chromosome partitioning protein